jgi:hAT family C-terminal dimerisation region
MPVRWNSTDKFLKAILHLEGAIRRVLRDQKWDDSVRENLTPTEEDWAQLKEMERFFNLFRKPTIASQADKYETLHNTIPDYVHILRHLNIWKEQAEAPTLKVAAKAACDIVDKYLKAALKTRHSCVALLCDPRYKLDILKFLYENKGGEASREYQMAKAHFQSVFSAYQKRANNIAEWHRQQAENTQPSRSPTPEDPEAWRLDPYNGFDAFVADRQQMINIAGAGPNTEVERWFREPLLHRKATPEEQKAFIQSKIYDFPIITQIVRDFTAIPATSAPSERVFSQAGNLVSKKRTRINSENLRYVLCLRSWGLLADDDIDDDNDNDDLWEPIINEDNGRIMGYKRREEVPAISN